MARLSFVAALALAGTSRAGLQLPLQAPFSAPWTHEVVPVDAEDAAGAGKDLPLVDSEKLQDRISSFALQERAETLYSIAKKGEEEYGHPTRVIGSQGKLPIP